MRVTSRNRDINSQWAYDIKPPRRIQSSPQDLYFTQDETETKCNYSNVRGRYQDMEGR